MFAPSFKFLRSLNLFVHDVQGKDYELVVQGLLFAIDPATSLFKVLLISTKL